MDGRGGDEGPYRMWGVAYEGLADALTDDPDDPNITRDEIAKGLEEIQKLPGLWEHKGSQVGKVTDTMLVDDGRTLMVEAEVFRDTPKGKALIQSIEKGAVKALSLRHGRVRVPGRYIPPKFKEISFVGVGGRDNTFLLHPDDLKEIQQSVEPGEREFAFSAKIGGLYKSTDVKKSGLPELLKKNREATAMSQSATPVTLLGQSGLDEVVSHVTQNIFKAVQDATNQAQGQAPAKPPAAQTTAGPEKKDESKMSAEEQQEFQEFLKQKKRKAEEQAPEAEKTDKTAEPAEKKEKSAAAPEIKEEDKMNLDKIHSVLTEKLGDKQAAVVFETMLNYAKEADIAKGEKASLEKDKQALEERNKMLLKQQEEDMADVVENLLDYRELAKSGDDKKIEEQAKEFRRIMKQQFIKNPELYEATKKIAKIKQASTPSQTSSQPTGMNQQEPQRHEVDIAASRKLFQSNMPASDAYHSRRLLDQLKTKQASMWQTSAPAQPSSASSSSSSSSGLGFQPIPKNDTAASASHQPSSDSGRAASRLPAFTDLDQLTARLQGEGMQVIQRDFAASKKLLHSEPTFSKNINNMDVLRERLDALCLHVAMTTDIAASMIYRTDGEQWLQTNYERGQGRHRPMVY